MKVAISAWPIVFAAVVAQCFKTWATYRLEKGIRLMELEQLVGSNSFGSAMKQPLLLRRIGILTIFLFLVWCFSPLGTQALQHIFSQNYEIIAGTTPATYVDMTGPNLAFAPATINQPSQGKYNQLLQSLAQYYQASLLPISQFGSNEDIWKHPIIVRSDLNGYAWNLGLPVFLKDSALQLNGVSLKEKLGDPRWQKYSTIVSTSYFEFTCGAKFF